ncbi:hypothetical protein [Saccharospirillum mangrovi]|uniref:hypothetical protein n=1 Tax=Saccharospirillum mangrovi TaxID=2161747 RepID=UPI000D35C518|nr:hypothetical protein [Saccharospirillum mangrovi]
MINGVRSVTLLCLLPLSALADNEVWLDVGAGFDQQWLPESEDASVQHLEARFNTIWYPQGPFEFGVQYGLEQRAFLAGSATDTEPTTADFRLADLDAALIEDDDIALYQNLDRLYGQWYSPVGDITLGRQAIGFGLAKRFSPVDVVQPAGLRATERRYRPGVDAVRWLIPAGVVSEVDLGWVFGDDELLFARGYSQVGATSLELTALTLNREQQLYGVGAQGSLGLFGVWQETAWLTDDNEDGLRLTVGADHLIWRDIYLQFEYHFNGLGADDSDDYDGLSDSAFYRSGLVLPLAQHYASTQVVGSLGALYQFQLGTDYNLIDGSELNTASLVRSLGDNTELTLALSFPFERKKVDSNNSTEFGVYPTVFSVNWSTVF